jgi:hypothetical protein
MRASLAYIGAGLLLGTTVLSGCSSSNLDIDKLETNIATEMQSQLGLSGTPTVTCPDSVPIEQGNVFTCTAELDGDTVDVEVTQTDDKGNVSWETVQPTG